MTRNNGAARARRRILAAVAAVVASGLFTGCALFSPLPPPTALEDRLSRFPTAGLPLDGAVTVHWDDHQIPFIEAERDDDAAFVLGLVHAHLRLGQMEIYKRIAAGRIAETGGPLATDIDHGLRVIDFGKAAAAIEADLPPDTRRWMERYVAGVNHYRATARELPYEYGVLGLEREPWTIADSLTFGRLAGTDVNWLVWINLLALRDRPDWPRLWARLAANGSASIPSFAGSRDTAGGQRLFEEILGGLSRSGSNSLAVAASRTTTGSALIASDPHLGLNLPNIWLIAGIKSPSHHAVGLMVPGLPFFAIGRNPWIAWGGTNMRAAASDLYDVTNLPADATTTRRESIKVRWWFDRDVEVRETPLGPVLSDVPLVAERVDRLLALRWTGHQPSDEVTAMLRVAQARDFGEFRRAFAGFAVPGQNMLYADNAGNIGQVMAVRLPGRAAGRHDDMILRPGEAEESWRSLRSTLELPYAYNPPPGYLASANNRPAADSDVAAGYFFSPDDRMERMSELMADFGRVGVTELMNLQQDVFMSSSAALRDLFLAKLREAGLDTPADAAERRAVDLLAAWDGHYTTRSQGAVAFEFFRNALTEAFYKRRLGEDDWSAFVGAARIKSLLYEDLEDAEPAEVAEALRAGLAAAGRGIGKFAEWGEMHRLVLAHPLGLVPVIGSRYRFADYAIGGSTDTLMKTAHSSTEERHDTRYGSNARHISDLSNVDHNYFVLLGGQDGWLNSSTFLDQVPLWLAGRYVEVPLRVEAVRARFTRKMELGR